MIDPTSQLSVNRQARMLGISRSCVDYQPRPISTADLKMMYRIEKLHMEPPFAGSLMLQGLLVQEYFNVGQLHVATLMKRMGIRVLYRRPNTFKPALGHKIYPYLLQNLPVFRPNQVWAMDITYIPMARGFIYLAAVMDWFTRRLLACWVSITLEAGFCIAAVQEALARHQTPEIFNTDQGSQFTLGEFIKMLADRGIKISMDLGCASKFCPTLISAFSSLIVHNAAFVLNAGLWFWRDYLAMTFRSFAASRCDYAESQFRQPI